MKYMKHLILAVTLLALAAGSAQAMECVAGAKSANARAEGETEMIGEITVRCRGRRTLSADNDLTLGADDPTKLEIAVTLNTDITNPRDDDDMIASMTPQAMPTYGQGHVMLAGHQLDASQAVGATTILDDGSDNGGLTLTGDVSDDLRTVTWKHTDTDPDDDDANFDLALFQLGSQGNGFEFKVSGLRADASGVGDGNDITATVKVNGTTAGSADMKVAGVANGLDPVVTAAKGRECDKAEDAMAKVTIKEGNRYSFNQNDSFVITLRNVPEGVSVTVPEMVGLVADDPNTNANENAESFILELVEGRAGDGVGKLEGGMAPVELSATGTGEFRYTIGMIPGNDGPDETPGNEDDVEAMDTVSTANYVEWQDLPIYFSWSGGGVSMNTDAMVYVSFYPSGGSMIPRFAGASDADGVLTIEDCVTMLTFPFVSSASGYDTGIVVSNTADASGSCTASYSGSDDTMSSPVVEGNSHWIFLVSTHMQDYTGRLEVECDFGGIDGYAQINDHMGNANGYLPRM